MQKILIFISFILLMNNVNAQIPPPGSYVQDTNLNKFVGTWQWTSGTDTFRIFFQKQIEQAPSPLNYQRDILVGWHRYVKNGVLIESNMQHVGQHINTNLYSIWASSYSSTVLRIGGFKNIAINKWCGGSFTLLPNSTTQAVLDIKGTFPHKNPNFSVPIYVTFTKLNITPPNGSFGK